MEIGKTKAKYNFEQDKKKSPAPFQFFGVETQTSAFEVWTQLDKNLLNELDLSEAF